MAGITYGALPAPDSQPTLWTGLDMVWNGWDGSIWSLTDPIHGSVMLPGVRGFSMPPVEHFKDDYASVAGSRWRGYRVGEREVFWPIQIYTDAGSQAWIERDRAFWNTMHPGKTGIWVVRQPNGNSRSLTLRFKDDGTQEFAVDPVMIGWTNYGITLTAEQPFWEGQPIRASFQTGAGSNFFGGSGAPPFNISPANTISTAKLDNPGNEPAWPTWTIVGPFSSFSLTVDGRTVASSTITASAGQSLVIESDPTKRSAKLNGVDVMGQITSTGFAPIPAGTNVNMSLALTGTGSINVSFIPLYHRAW